MVYLARPISVYPDISRYCDDYLELACPRVNQGLMGKLMSVFYHFDFTIAWEILFNRDHIICCAWQVVDPNATDGTQNIP